MMFISKIDTQVTTEHPHQDPLPQQQEQLRYKLQQNQQLSQRCHLALHIM
jgi:hypothetical protein